MTKILIALAFLVISNPLLISSVNAKDLAGWIEPVVVYPNGINFNAKLDTGAANSSLNTPRIEQFTKNSEDYVRFDVKSREGNAHTLELPMIKNVTIKRHFGKSQTRPVVSLKICLGNKIKEVPVNLVDRTGFNYQLLLGRSFLSPDTLVDSSKQNLTQPQCVTGK